MGSVLACRDPNVIPSNADLSLPETLKPLPSALPSYDVHDPLYGTVRINSACAIEIIQLPEFTRLKSVLQHGITALIGCLPRPLINRFDHSLGAMVLVKHVGGSEEAQLAALLHDVAHTALSHVVDSVFGYVVHEVEKHEYLGTTQIPEVLRKHGFDPQRVFNEELFPLLELPSPHICADRLDYALRDSVSFGFLALEDAQEIFRSLTAIDGHMVLSSQRAASILAGAYLSSDQHVWADAKQAHLYKLAAQVIRIALKEGLIDKKQLWSHGDEAFWNAIATRASPGLSEMIARITPHCTLSELPIASSALPDQDPHSTSTHELCTLKLRVRTLDPPVNTPDGIKPLSALDTGFGERRLKYIESRKQPATFSVHYLATEPTSEVVR